MVINPIVGVYIDTIIRIPIKGGMTIPNIATFDHGTDALIRLDPKDNGSNLEGPEKGAVGCEDDVFTTQRGAKRTHINPNNHWVVGIPSWELTYPNPRHF